MLHPAQSLASTECPVRIVEAKEGCFFFREVWGAMGCFKKTGEWYSFFCLLLVSVGKAQEDGEP